MEVRTCRTTTTLTLRRQWPGLSQGFELTRERTEKGRTTREVSYGMTSLTPEKAGAGKILGLARGHWGIENRLHWVRDVTLGEDGSRVRSGSAPEVMAGLRNCVVSLAREVAPCVAEAIRRLGNCFSKALSLVGLPQIE